jgi:N-acetylmuramoyl-L-alanine amidase
MIQSFKPAMLLVGLLLFSAVEGNAQTDSLKEQSIEFRRIPPEVTYDSVFNVLCKSEYPADAMINGEAVKMYETGIFFKAVKFTPGKNIIRAEVIPNDGQKVVAETETFFDPEGKPKSLPFPLWFDTASIQPAMDHILLPQDQIALSFKGSKGQSAYARIRPGNLKIPLSRKDFTDYSLYEGILWLSNLKKQKVYSITYVLESPKGKSEKLKAPASVKVQDIKDFSLVVTKSLPSLLTYNLGPVRLGGPIITEFPPGVHLQVNGSVGEYFRIHLDKSQNAMITKASVEPLPTSAIKPGYFLQYASAAPGEGADIVNIPYLESVPYAVIPEPDQQRIRVVLYGVQTSSTWLSHRKGLKIVDHLTWQQTTPDTYEMMINLKTSQLWGYELVHKGRSMQLMVKHPPVFEKNKNGLAVKGLVVAIEAGHGGHNTGATGLSGMLEKDVNLAVAKKLADICQNNDIEVVMVRETDTYMSLQDKRAKVENSNAHLLISIHANSANPRGDYLRVGGVSTYYHNPFWADFAEIMYEELLVLPLDEFGVVGSFNYLVTRMSSRPAILVEQGFMSHAEDEEKLADPEFRNKLAEHIFLGMVEYLEFMD